jgi:hypothetical protein
MVMCCSSNKRAPGTEHPGRGRGAHGPPRVSGRVASSGLHQQAPACWNHLSPRRHEIPDLTFQHYLQQPLCLCWRGLQCSTAGSSRGGGAPDTRQSLLCLSSWAASASLWKTHPAVATSTRSPLCPAQQLPLKQPTRLCMLWTWWGLSGSRCSSASAAAVSMQPSQLLHCCSCCAGLRLGTLLLQVLPSCCCCCSASSPACCCRLRDHRHGATGCQTVLRVVRPGAGSMQPAQTSLAALCPARHARDSSCDSSPSWGALNNSIAPC